MGFIFSNYYQCEFNIIPLTFHLFVMKKILIQLAILPIRLYQWIISPIFGANCRHEPTCSQYTIEAVKEWGPLRGLWLGVKRLSSCHPWGTHGHDPIPKKKDENSAQN